MRNTYPLRIISKTLTVLLLTVTLQAQQADALKLAVTQGAPALPLSKKDAKKLGPLSAPVIVEVRDEAGRIVPGARVQINEPAGKQIIAWTDTEGRAYIDGVIPTGQEGKLPMTAEARFNGKLGATTFNNTAMPPPPADVMRMFTFSKQNHKMRDTLLIAGAVGVAALAIALALTLPGGSTKLPVVVPPPVPPTPTTVSIGGIGVGGPQ
jgi:hypothetical protein